jgi:hypothetical protein
MSKQPVKQSKKELAREVAEYEEKKSKTKAYMSEKVQCEVCNCELTRASLSQHNKSRKHFRNLKQINTALVESHAKMTKVNLNDDSDLDESLMKTIKCKSNSSGKFIFKITVTMKKDPQDD